MISIQPLKCTQCPSHFTTIITSDEVKNWTDVCLNCGTANDIIGHPEKYEKFQPKMVKLLKYLKPTDIRLIVCKEPFTLYGDLIGELHYVDGEIDWFELINDFNDLLQSVEANNLKLAQCLHHRLVNDQWWYH
jgi:hypothetical protein